MIVSAPKKEFVFSNKQAAKEFVARLKKEGRRLDKASVRKTKGWKTYSAHISFFSLGDTVGLVYEPEQAHYRAIMRDLA